MIAGKLCGVTESRNRPARLEDVAREAGVHVSTVSRVLNARDAPTVRPETRERILDAHRRCATGRTRSPAVSRPRRPARSACSCPRCGTLSTPRSSAARSTAAGRGARRGAGRGLAARAPSRPRSRWSSEGRIDGLLIASARPGRPILERFAESHVPCVFVNRRQPGSGRNVSMREEDAGRLAAEHLIGLGHRRLGHLAAAALDTRGRRMQGFVDTALAAGAERAGRGGGVRGARRLPRRDELLGGRRPPTGVFVSNLNQAVGALAACAASGLVGARRCVAGRLRRRPADRVPRGAADGDPHAAVGAGRARGRCAHRTARRRRAPRPRDRDRAGLVVRASTAPPPPDVR